MHRDAVPAGKTAGALALRLVQVVVGTALMGLAVAVLVRSALGLLPLDVLHRATGDRVGWTIGGAIIAVQSFVLVINLSLGVRPGVGTVASVVVPAVVADAALTVLPVPDVLWLRVAGLVLGGVLFALGTSLYLAAGLGGLPRDGLMLEIARRTSWGLARIRVAADLLCLTAGVLIINPVLAVRTGTLGVGSVVLALLLGPAIARLLPAFSRRQQVEAEVSR
ncbi:YczE/YyaS/YitT family protein [Lentzea chajnantorensis]